MVKDLDYDALFPGRFMKAGEFMGRDVTMTIADVILEDLEGKKGKRKAALISFKERPKQLVLNKTNGECLKGLFGRRVGDWIGKRITLFPATVDAFGEETLAIRVRGSPDIAADKTVTANLGQKTRTIKLLRTSVGGQKQNAKPAPNQAPPPAPDPMHDPNAEPPPDVFGDQPAA